jgi:hypothetical protein
MKRAASNRAGVDQLVPYVQHIYTDKLTLPPRVESILRVTKTTEQLAAINQSATTPVADSFSFYLSNVCNDYSSYTAIFDQYRILALEVMFTPQANEALITSAQPTGQYATVIDYDDNTNLGSMAAALNYANCIVSPMTGSQRRCFKPRVASALYNGSFVGYGNIAAPWIDCSTSNVVHYGIKTFTDTGYSGAIQVINVTIRAVIEFRATR